MENDRRDNDRHSGLTRSGEDTDLADRRALRALRSGETSAYAEIVRRHGPGLHRLLARMLRDEHTAEDLLQEVFVKAWRALDQFDPSRPLFPWLRTIAIHAALNEMRKKRRRREVSDPDKVLPFLASTARSEGSVEFRELQEAVEAAIEGLPPAWSAVFRLRIQEQLGYVEIAQALDIPLGSVMSSLSRARLRVTRQLRGEPVADEEAKASEEIGISKNASADEEADDE